MSLRILIVDDEPDLRMLLSARFKIAGFTPFTASNGQEAYELCLMHVGRFDIILSDLMMPKMGGLELLQALTRAGCGKIPFVLMSGSVEQEWNASLPRPAAYLAKPFGLDEVVQLAHRLIHKAPAQLARA